MNEDYWYKLRHTLEPEDVFVTHQGDFIKLKQRVPGDGTQWYIYDWFKGWNFDGSYVEPSDLFRKLKEEDITG